jgi:hypothetical protein
LKTKLTQAFNEHAILQQMSPSILSGDQDAFIAYEPSKHVVDGARDEIATLRITQGLLANSEIKLPSGVTLTCPAMQTCTIPISKQQLSGVAEVTSGPAGQMGAGMDAPSGGGRARPGIPVLRGRADLLKLIKSKSITVAGVTITIQ